MKRTQTYVVASLVATLTALVVASVARPAQAQGEACLHGPDESPVQAERRQQAVRLARQINPAQSVAFSQMLAYRPLNELSGVATAPAGFSVQLAADAAGYAFSLKDGLDACQFLLFSDQDGVIYEGQTLRR